MARIIGTRGSDDLTGTDGADIIDGRQDNDLIYSGTGFDIVRGGRGNDDLKLESEGVGYGGNGWDSLWSRGADLIGGPGNDIVAGTGGDLYGDVGPGTSQRVGGNDTISTYMYFDTIDPASQTGGGGSDLFTTVMHADGVASVVTVTDFRAGEDTLCLGLGYTDGPFENGFLDQNQVFDIISGGDGVIDNYTQADGNAEVWSDVESNRLIIRLHEDHVVIQFSDDVGPPIIDQSDYLFA